MTIGAAGTHLRPVGRKPADFQTFAHAHFGQQLAEQEDALSAKAGQFDSELLKSMWVWR